MILIVGLGNPGKKYQQTRHNIGFRVVDELRSSSRFANAHVINELRSSSRFANAHVIDKLKPLNLKGVTLVKPQTFMNLSGKAVKSLITNYKTSTANLWIVHDDIDLPLGKIRIVKNRGAAGHKGIESIIRELKTKNFIRFRIGIQPKSGKARNPEKFVLQKFNKDEEKIVKGAIQRTVEAVECTLKNGLEKAQSIYNICARPRK